MANSDRDLALLEGKPFYFGRPCNLGHFLRYTTTYKCVVCARTKWRRLSKRMEKANMKIIGFLSEAG